VTVVEVQPGEGIQAAIDSLPLVGGTVRLLDGTHNLPANNNRVYTRSGVTIEGESRAGTIVRKGGSRVGFDSENFDAEDVVFRRMTLHMDDDGDFQTMIRLAGPNNALIEDVTIINDVPDQPGQTWTAVSLRHPTNTVVQDSDFTRCQVKLSGPKGGRNLICRRCTFDRPHNFAVSAVTRSEGDVLEHVRIEDITVTDAISAGAIYWGNDNGDGTVQDMTCSHVLVQRISVTGSRSDSSGWRALTGRVTPTECKYWNVRDITVNVTGPSVNSRGIYISHRQPAGGEVQNLTIDEASISISGVTNGDIVVTESAVGPAIPRDPPSVLPGEGGAPGVDPTGMVDSTSAIQAALDAQDEVYLPAGVYSITFVRLNNGNSLRGAGRTETVLRVPQERDLTALSGVGCVDGATLTLMDLAIDGQGGSYASPNLPSPGNIQHHGISFGANTTCFLAYLYVHGFVGSCLLFGSGTVRGYALRTADSLVGHCYDTQAALDCVLEDCSVEGYWGDDSAVEAQGDTFISFAWSVLRQTPQNAHDAARQAVRLLTDRWSLSSGPQDAASYCRYATVDFDGNEPSTLAYGLSTYQDGSQDHATECEGWTKTGNDPSGWVADEDFLGGVGSYTIIKAAPW